MTRNRGRSQAVAAPAVLLALVAAGTVAALALACRRFLRYEIAGESMRPSLDPGDFVIVDRAMYRRHLPVKGQIVLARDPRAPQREIVKRVERIDLHGDLWLVGDYAKASTGSETFGAVPANAIIGRVRWRYWPVRALFRVR